MCNHINSLCVEYFGEKRIRLVKWYNSFGIVTNDSAGIAIAKVLSVYGKNVRDNARLWVCTRILRPATTIIDMLAAENGMSKKKLLERLDPLDKAMNYNRHAG